MSKCFLWQEVTLDIHGGLDRGIERATTTMKCPRLMWPPLWASRLGVGGLSTITACTVSVKYQSLAQEVSLE